MFFFFFLNETRARETSEANERRDEIYYCLFIMRSRPAATGERRHAHATVPAYTVSGRVIPRRSVGRRRGGGDGGGGGGGGGRRAARGPRVYDKFFPRNARRREQDVCATRILFYINSGGKSSSFLLPHARRPSPAQGPAAEGLARAQLYLDNGSRRGDGGGGGGGCRCGGGGPDVDTSSARRRRGPTHTHARARE